MPETPENPEVEDLIRYDILAQDALRGVVKKVLQEVARTGLPGEHHFYVTFDTNYPGVRMSDRMKEKYPEEMTIVIQHQFWDLVATDSGFSIGLAFDKIPETMAIPYAAIRGFFDPAVQFGLQFDADEDTSDKDEDGDASALPAPPELEKIEDSQSATKKKKSAKQAKAAAVEAKQEETDGEPSSADVVSLDAFRKK